MLFDKIGNVVICMICVFRFDIELKYVMKFVCIVEEMECNVIYVIIINGIFYCFILIK